MELDQCHRSIQRHRRVLDGLYILLNLDQLPIGIWGYSIPLFDQPAFTHEKIKGSPTVSAAAAVAISTYSRDIHHPALMKFLEYVNQSHDSSTGAFGRRVRYTSDPDVQENFYIVRNCRHTARFIWVFLSLFGLSRTATDGVAFLVNSQSKDGWAINPDDPSQGPDPLTVAYVLQTLDLARELGIDKMLSPKDSRRLRIAVVRGLSWLAESSDDGFWVFRHNLTKRYQYTAMVLSSVPELAKEYPEVYSQAVERMLEHAQENRMLFMNPQTGGVDFTTTALFWDVLLKSPGYEDNADLLLGNLFSAFEEQKHVVLSQAPDWAFPLELVLARFEDCTLTEERRAELDNVTESLRVVMGVSHLPDIQTRVSSDMAWIAPAIVSCIARNEKQGTFADAFTSLRSELMGLLNEERARFKREISQKRSQLERYANEVTASYGQDAGRQVLEKGDAQLCRETEGFESRYSELANQIEAAQTVEDLIVVRGAIERGLS